MAQTASFNDTSFSTYAYSTSEPISINTSFATTESGSEPYTGGDNYTPYYPTISQNQDFDFIPATVAPVTQDPITPPLQAAVWQNKWPFPSPAQSTPGQNLWNCHNSYSSPDTFYSSSPHKVSEQAFSESSLDSPPAVVTRGKKRARQACTRCQAKKAKCNEGRPRCEQCLSSNEPCSYIENKPNKKLDAQQLSEKIRDCLTIIDSQKSSLEKDIISSIKRIEELQEKTAQLEAENAQLKAQQCTKCLIHHQWTGQPGAGNVAGCEELLPLENNQKIYTADTARSSKLDERGESNSASPGYQSSAKSILTPPTSALTPTQDIADSWAAVNSCSQMIRKHQLCLTEEAPGEILAQLVKEAVEVQERINCDEASSTNIPREIISRCPQEIQEKEKAKELWKHFETIHSSCPFLDVDRITTLIDRLAGHRAPSTPKLKRKHNEEVPSPGASAYPGRGGEVYQHKSASPTNFRQERQSPNQNLESKSFESQNRFLPCPPSICFSTLRRAGFLVHDHLSRSNISASENITFKSSTLSPCDIPGLYYYYCAIGHLGELGPIQDLSFIHAKILAAIYLLLLVRPGEARVQVEEAFDMLEQIREKSPASISINLDHHLNATYQTCYSLASVARLDISSPNDVSYFESKALVTHGPLDSIDISSDVRPDLSTIVRSFANVISLLQEPAPLQSNSKSNDKEIQVKVEENHINVEQVKTEAYQWRSRLGKIEGFRSAYYADLENALHDSYKARRVAKFYTYEANIHRPFLHHLLRNLAVDSKPQFSNFTFGILVNPSLGFDNNTLSSPFDDEVMRSAKSCVDALMKITETFDAISFSPTNDVAEDNLELTQSQFANIIVLAEALFFKNIGEFINLDRFMRLLNGTITTFTSFAPLSSTVETELRILLDVRDEMLTLRSNVLHHQRLNHDETIGLHEYNSNARFNERGFGIPLC